jgi:polysaccharide biosynthesis protein PslJ
VSAGAAAGLPAPPAGALASIRRTELGLWALVAFAVVATLAATRRGIDPALILAFFVFPLTLVAFQRTLLAWQTLLGLILLVILFVPIRRYTVAIGGPIELEPYRILIAIVLGCWFLALAADPNVRWRSTGLGRPIAVLWLAILASIALNLGRVNANSALVIKSVTFFGSYFLVMHFVTSVIRDRRQFDRNLKLVIGGFAVVAVCGLYEWRSGQNLFNWLGQVIPGLTYVDQGEAMIRGTGARALASAQHPIALGAVLVMLMPLSVYLFKRTGSVFWLVCGGLMTLGALSTGSRTAALMLIVSFLVFLWLKRAEMVRMLPLVLCLMVVIQGAMPGTLGSFKGILNPAYIVKEQSQEMGTGSGRLADLGPSLKEWAGGNPFVGQGFGTRVTTQEGVEGGAQILDNQWLGSLLEIGAVGLLALAWLFLRAIGKLARRSRTDTGADSWLAACLAASLMSFITGLFTYDAFSFIQVTFLAFIVLGFAAIVTRHDPPGAAART